MECGNSVLETVLWDKINKCITDSNKLDLAWMWGFRLETTQPFVKIDPKLIILLLLQRLNLNQSLKRFIRKTHVTLIDVLSKQLEKTRNDLQSDLLDMEWRLDHEGKEFHHFDDFCQLYRAEILNLNRTLVNIFCYTFFVTAFLGQDNFSHGRKSGLVGSKLDSR